MEKTYQIQNVKCGGCSNTLKKALLEDYGEVTIDLDKMPREITLTLKDEEFPNLKLKLRSLGYPLVDDELSTLQTINTKAKSFVSCAIGKFDS